MVIWIVFRGLLLPHKSNPISLLLIILSSASHCPPDRVQTLWPSLQYSKWSGSFWPLWPSLPSFYLLVLVMGNFLSVFVRRPCSFLPEVIYLILSPLSYSHPLSVLYETLSNHSPSSGIYSVQQDVKGGAHNPKHPTGPGQWSTRSSPLKVQGCLRDSAEGTVGTE